MTGNSRHFGQPDRGYYLVNARFNQIKPALISAPT